MGVSSITKLLKDTNVINVTKKLKKRTEVYCSVSQKWKLQKITADISKKIDDTKKYAKEEYETDKEYTNEKYEVGNYVIKNPVDFAKKIPNTLIKYLN